MTIKGFRGRFLGRVLFCVSLPTRNTEGRVQVVDSSPFTSCQERGASKGPFGRPSMCPSVWSSGDELQTGFHLGELRAQELKERWEDKVTMLDEPAPRHLCAPGSPLSTSCGQMWATRGEGWCDREATGYVPGGWPGGVKGLQTESVWNGLLRTRR